MLDDNGTFRRGLKEGEDVLAEGEEGQGVVELEENAEVDEGGIEQILNYIRQETADLLRCLKEDEGNLHSLAKRFGHLAYNIVASGHWGRPASNGSLEGFEKAMGELCGEEGIWKQIHQPSDRKKIEATRNMPKIIRHITRIHWVVTLVRNEVDDDLAQAFSNIRVAEINLMDYKFLAPPEAANDVLGLRQLRAKRKPIVKKFQMHKSHQDEDETPENNLIKIDFASRQNKIEPNKMSPEPPKPPILFKKSLQPSTKKGFRVKRFKFSPAEEDEIE